MKFCLIACASKKRSTASPARKLYLSALYQKSVDWMERNQFDKWFILSAKHGLIEPQKILEPYDLTLNSMKAQDRRAWAQSVLSDLLAILPQNASVTFLAGSKYRQYLIQPLIQRGYEVNVPLKGLPIGNQLQWLDQN